MNKFKVGDKVRVKSADWYEKNKNKDGFVICSNWTAFNSEMTIWLGCIATIISITDTGKYIIEGCSYRFVDDMLEDEVVEEAKTTKPKFKVGDRVTVKSLKWYNANKDRDGIVTINYVSKFTKPMSQWCGKIIKIKKVFYDGDYLADCDFIFSEAMLEDEVVSSSDEHEVLYGKHEDRITICNRHNTFFDVYHNGKVAYSLDRYNLLVLLTEMLLPEEKNMMKKFRPIKDQMDYVTKD